MILKCVIRWGGKKWKHTGDVRYGLLERRAPR